MLRYLSRENLAKQARCTKDTIARLEKTGAFLPDAIVLSPTLGRGMSLFHEGRIDELKAAIGAAAAETGGPLPFHHRPIEVQRAVSDGLHAGSRTGDIAAATGVPRCTVYNHKAAMARAPSPPAAPTKRLLLPETVLDIRRRAASGETIAEIGRALGIAIKTVEKIVTGATYTNQDGTPVCTTPTYRLTDAQVCEIRRRRDAKERLIDIAVTMGIGWATVEKVARRESYRHVPESVQYGKAN